MLTELVLDNETSILLHGSDREMGSWWTKSIVKSCLSGLESQLSKLPSSIASCVRIKVCRWHGVTEFHICIGGGILTAVVNCLSNARMISHIDYCGRYFFGNDPIDMVSGSQWPLWKDRSGMQKGKECPIIQAMDAWVNDLDEIWINEISSSRVDGSLNLTSSNKANIPSTIQNAM